MDALELFDTFMLRLNMFNQVMAVVEHFGARFKITFELRNEGNLVNRLLVGSEVAFPLECFITYSILVLDLQ